MFDNPLLLMLLVLAIAIMAGYYYLKRAQSRDSADVESPANQGEPRTDGR